MIPVIRAAIAVAAVLSMSACALSRSEVSMAQPAKVANPAAGTLIAIVKVEDQRSFQISPPDPAIPSLKDDKISDVSITSRAVARKRNSYGMALGDVLLPEGETVAGLIETAVADGFRKAGYRVAKKGEPNYSQAVPVTVSVTQFWSWFTPGFFQVTVANRGDVTLSGALPALSPTLMVHNDASDQMMGVTENDWKKIVDKGLDQMSDKVAEALKAKSGPKVSMAMPSS